MGLITRTQSVCLDEFYSPMEIDRVEVTSQPIEKTSQMTAAGSYPKSRKRQRAAEERLFKKQKQGNFFGKVYTVLLQKIFVFLDPREMKAAARVCREFEKVFTSESFLRDCLEAGHATTHMKPALKRAIEWAIRFPNLKHFNLTQHLPNAPYIDDSDLKDLVSTCSSLRGFQLESPSLVTDEGLKCLASLSHLSRLSLCVEPILLPHTEAPLISSQSLKIFSSYRNLTDLALIKMNHAFVDSLTLLVALPKLQHLKLKECLTLEDQNLGVIESLSQLKSLEIYKPGQINGLFFQYLAKLNNFSQLILYRCKLEKKNLPYLLAARKLSHLEFSQCTPFSLTTYAPFLPQLTLFKLNGTKDIVQGGKRHL